MLRALRSFSLALGLSSLAACARPPEGPAAKVPPSSTEDPAPAVALHDEGSFEGKGGVSLYEQSWRPAGTPRAVLVIMHGLKDHSSRYAEAAARLCAAGYAVHAFDMRGHGRSGGRRVEVESFDDYVDDLATFYARVKSAEPGRPIFVFGHSMGGAIATLFVLDKKPDAAGLVLSAPAIRVDVGSATRGGAKLMGAIAPNAKLLEIDSKGWSRDPAVVDDNEHDPLVFHDPGPARTAAQLFKAMDRIQDRMTELSSPVLLMHGTSDVITSPRGSRDLYEKASSSDKTLHLYPGLYHDLLNEPEKARVLGDMIAWLDGHTQFEGP